MELLQYMAVAFIGIASGIVVSSAVFSVIVALGAINKTASILGRADKIKLLEWMVSIGAIIFNIIYLFANRLYGGYMTLSLLGGFFGVFVGIMLMALAEVTRVIPVLFMRLKDKDGIIYIVLATALGKVMGCLFGFL